MKTAIKKLLIGIVVVFLFLPIGCIMVDGGTTHRINGAIVNSKGKPVYGWVGATDIEAKPESACEPINIREEWGDPEKTLLGLTHTTNEGSFCLDYSRGITWGYTLLFGFIPLSSTTPPVPPVLDQIYIHVHDDNGWHTVRVPLNPEQQSRSKPGERWIDISKIIIH